VASTQAAAGFLADLLADGLATAVADRVVDYLGEWGRLKLRLRARSWTAANCKLLADTARDVLSLKRQLHEAVGELVSRALPPNTSAFHRELVKKIAAKVPLEPLDTHLEAIARGLQLVGIYMCLVLVRLDTCPCLLMWGEHATVEQAKQYLTRDIQRLLDQSERDLQARR